MADIDDTAPPPPIPRASAPGSGIFTRLNIMAVLLAFTWILAVVGTAEPVWERFDLTFDGTTDHITQSLWQLCNNAGCEADNFIHGLCSEQIKKYNAARAFTIIVDLFLAFVVIAALARAFLPSVELRFSAANSILGRIYTWTLFGVMFFAFLAWPVLLSLYDGTRCGGDVPAVKSASNTRLGSAGMFFLDVWILLLLITIAECLKGRGVFSGDSDASYPSLA